MSELSVWEKETFYAPHDVIIVGGGFVGLWSAYYLKKYNPKLSVLILERGVIPTGASTRNAGFACFGSVTELLADEQRMGEDTMLSIVEMRFKGLKRITKLFKDKQIGYEASGGYELLGHTSHPDVNELRSTIDRFNQWLREITGKEKTFHLQDGKISSFGFSDVAHLIENKLEGQLHPGKLCQALITRVQAMGVHILNATAVSRYERINGHISLWTTQDQPLQTDQLLICTNAFAKQWFPDLDMDPARGQVLVTSEISGLSFKGSFHYDEGFYYFRQLGNRVLLGGARNKALEAEKTYDLETSETIQKELEHFLQQVVIPGKPYSIEHRWSGIMGIGTEKTPILKQVDPEIFCALRMSGMGVALAPEVGKIMAEKMRPGKS